jgi:hypothetical protein
MNNPAWVLSRSRGAISMHEMHQFHEALGNSYSGKVDYEDFSKRINEVGYLLNRMMKNVQKACDNYEIQPKSKRLHSIAKQ